MFTALIALMAGLMVFRKLRELGGGRGRKAVQ